MKKRFFAALAFFALMITGNVLFAGADPEDILGTWMVPAKDAAITIIREGDKYTGTITWRKDPEEIDDQNPDPALKTRKVLGINLLNDFIYDDGEWRKGKIYDPGSGKLYSCIMWMEGEDKLWVKGYIGISLIGRKEMWTRVKEELK